MAVKRTTTPKTRVEIMVPFVLERETKNTFRYSETDENGNILPSAEAKIGTIYLKKELAGEMKSFTVTIAED